MPIVNIDLAWLNRLLGRDLPADTIRESLEQLGCDVEDVLDVARSRCPQCDSLVEHPIGQDNVKSCTLCGYESESPFVEAGSLRAVRLDLLAARPDLFDVGGLSRALKGTLEIELGLPDYPLGSSNLKVIVDPSVRRPQSYHPYVQVAVVIMPPLDETSLVAIMKLQENLHWGVCRDRKLASIGVYDLETLEGDIEFTTLHPDDEPFVPLGKPGQPMSGRQILEEHPKGIGYAHLLANHDRYPLLRDQRGQVLSMPPIINSDETKVKKGTRRIFVDVTGTSRAAVVKALDTLVCSLAELGGHLEAVEIVDQGKTRISPDLSPRSSQVELHEAQRWLGLPLDPTIVTKAMRRMRFDIEPVNDEQTRFRVDYPPYRTDIRHMVDLLEDIAIGYGYQNIEPRLVPSMTVGESRPEERLSEQARLALIGLGYSEVMSLPLTTPESHFERLRIDTPDAHASISNPKLKAYTVLRTHLRTGLMECLHENRRRPLPLKIFEVDNSAQLDPECETGTREERRVALAEMGRDAGYAAVRATLDTLLRELGAEGRYAAVEHPSFVPGRVARFTTERNFHGLVGEVHPEVLSNFGLKFPVAVAELTLYRIY